MNNTTRSEKPAPRTLLGVLQSVVPHAHTAEIVGDDLLVRVARGAVGTETKRDREFVESCGVTALQHATLIYLVQTDATIREEARGAELNLKFEIVD